MALVPEAVGLADRPHTPEPGDPQLATYKEWWHFNVVDDAAHLDLIANISISGDPRTVSGGRAHVILLTHHPATGWMGGVEEFHALGARLSEVELDIEVGSTRVAFADGRFRLQAEHYGNRPVTVDLALTPRTEPMMVWKDTPIGSGHINWLIIPYLHADGTARVGGREHRIDGARAYHDHNWGHWRWGDNFGWDWGFCAAAADVEGMPLSFVYDRTVDRAGARVAEHSLALWRGESLFKFFARRMIRARTSGWFRAPVRRIPGVGNLVNATQVATIPGRVEISARDDDDWIEANYVPDAALQISVPRERGFGMVELNETLGQLTLSGSVAGQPFSATRRACFEFVR